MCELLVRTEDKINEDFYRNCQCTKRGDVIAVVEDDWNWGADELSHPFWTIIKMPGVSIEEANFLITPEMPTDPFNPSKTLQRRAVRLNLDDQTLTPPARGGRDGTPPDGRQDFTVDTIDGVGLFNLGILKKAIADPQVIGDNPAVIG